ncbi:hypothetical protein [Kluyvera ascorbata]|uniref:hypothetical protein n=1 Tax=Kluyvera ascorbata TaxID=51288 RepID=UPI0029004066|nr:hypothetical protein [Kluyvera ascorbata]MDU1198820.1 hypothetical protein [Kluyvera ascorbata]
MGNKWRLEDVVSILKTLGHNNLWYHEEHFGQLPVIRIIVSDDNRTVAMWSEEKHCWEIWATALTVFIGIRSSVAATGQPVTSEWLFQQMTIESC